MIYKLKIIMGIINFLDFIKYSSKTNENEERNNMDLLPEKVKRRLTEDGKGNYVFHHYSFKRRDVIKPTDGTGSMIVPKSESPALSSVGGVAQYYTMDSQKEPGTGPILHTVLVPKNEVYYLQTDALDFYDEAKERFEKVRPGQAFNPNYQAAWIGKLANERGFKMLVSEWRNGELRAQTCLPLIPETQNVEMKPIENETFEVGDHVNIYGRDVVIKEIKGNIIYYKGETSSGSINFERDWKLIKKI
jgi:hypothetical protein